MAGRSIRTFTVLPHLPERLQAAAQAGLQPVVVLEPRGGRAVPPHRRRPVRGAREQPGQAARGHAAGPARASSAKDDGFLAHMDRVEESLEQLHRRPRPGSRRRLRRRPGTASASPISPPSSASTRASRSTPAASASWPATISRAASDLGVPLVGVGLMYREGYFRQYLNVDGWQQERYPENDFFNLPLIPETDARRQAAARHACRCRAARCGSASGGSRSAGCRSTCSTPTSRRTAPRTARSPPGSTAATTTCASARRWSSASAASARCGRSGKTPTVCHMNEGHSAFCGLERIRAADGGAQARLRRGPRGGRGRHRASPRTRRCRPATTSSPPQLIEHYSRQLHAAA